MGFSGSAKPISGASDVALNSPAAGQVLTYGSNGKWQNQTGPVLASLKAVNIYTAGAYPTRPSGYGSVEWIGPVDPGASATNNDTWVNTA